jgi:hypothetical protein
VGLEGGALAGPSADQFRSRREMTKTDYRHLSLNMYVYYTFVVGWIILTRAMSQFTSF